nr:DUF433 domain-containing protein [Streptomyces sp. SID3343]
MDVRRRTAGPRGATGGSHRGTPARLVREPGPGDRRAAAGGAGATAADPLPGDRRGRRRAGVGWHRVRGGNLVIHQLVDVLAPFYKDGRHIPDLLNPRDHVAVDAAVRGGDPVIHGTRIPAAEVAALVRDGVPAGRIGDFYPGVTAAAARDAVDFSDYVDSYDGPRQVVA